MQAFDHYVTAVFVFFSDFFNALLRTVQSFDRADLNRRERAIVVVALNAGQCADEVTVSDHEADTPTGHVVALAHGEELNGDVLSTWHLHDGRSLEAVIDDVGVSQVMNNVDAVLLGKRNEFFKEVEIYALGGAQAIAAFSYGTESIKPVDIIVGPGNRFVTEAKRQCYGQVGIDFVAGPSEVLVIADGKASAKVVAADLLAQSEHDVNAKGILLTTDEAFGKSVIEAVEEELKILDTAKIARQSWDTFGEIGVVDSLDEAVQYANEYAPEHLEINVEDPDALIPKLVNYGSLFIGQNTAEVFGDYASGTNHTLPTLRAARYTGGVWVGTFLKTCTHQSMTPEASARIAPLVSRMAHGEGLSGHAAAADARK